MKRPTKKGKNKGLYIGIAAAVVVVIVAVVIGYNYWSAERRKERANQTAQTFIEQVEGQAYGELAHSVSSASLADISYSPQDVEERYETVYGGIGVTDVTAKNIDLAENEETSEYTLTYDLQMTTSLGELSPQSYSTTFHEMDDEFRVNWAPSLIFPEMEEGDTVRINFTSGARGSILDRNGELLAGAGPVWEAGLYPALLGDGEEQRENLEIIAETFETSVDYLENELAAAWVTPESFVPFTIVEEGETPDVTGVVYQETSARTYPLGEAGAHLIGYIGEVFAEDIEENPTLQAGDTIGKSGLEAAYDERLRGQRGGEITIQNSEGEVQRTLQEAPVEDGEDVTLTIDGNMQEEYYDQFGGSSGAAVVTKPTTGELLVLTSAPSYDPTLMARGISADAYEEYMENPELPFLPRYTARYAPASTFKVITAAIGLDSNTTTLDETRSINGLEWQRDDSWGNYQVTRVSEQPTEVNLVDALIYSDNIFFAQEAIEMGAETYLDGLRAFPFGESFDLPISMEPAQISNSGSIDSEMLLSDTSFGQGELLLSPIHQAIFYSPFVNEGELVFPKLEADADNAESIQPISLEAAETVNDILIDVVENPAGTAHGLNNSSYSLAAKTGTGEFQAVDAEDENDINGFLLTYDAENQSFLSLILVEGTGGSNVAEQFAPVFE
jgi:penicillin-binding protein